MTGGGPANKTLSLTYYPVNQYFTYGNIGYGSALAVITFVISMVIAMFFQEGMKSKMEVPNKK